MLSTQASEGRILTGQVKWFNATKGYGFVTCQEFDSDILLPAATLTAFGQSSIAEESAIKFLCRETPRGFQIVQIYETSAPETDPKSVGIVDDTDAPIIPARVKWFNTERGYGFANAFTDAADIFLHADILRKNGLTNLVEGEAICLRYVERESGRIATKVINWKMAEVVGQNQKDKFTLRLA